MLLDSARIQPTMTILADKAVRSPASRLHQDRESYLGPGAGNQPV